MRIAAEIPQLPMRMATSAELTGEEPTKDVTGFAQLLAAMLCAPPQEPAPPVPTNGLASVARDRILDCRAPALAPEIGTLGKSFEHGRLLVETSLAFPRLPSDLPEHRDGGHVSKRPGPEFGPDMSPARAPVVSGPSELPARWIAGTGAFTANPVVRAAAIPAPPSPAALPAVSEASPVPNAARQPALGPQDIDEPARSSAARPKAGTAPPRLAGQLSPFGAQLFALESGLRLVLRIPRLATGERAELETGLSRLLDGLGHRRHEIVIHEIAMGEG